MTDRSPSTVARDAVPGYRAAERAVAAIRAAADRNHRALLAQPVDLAAQVVDAAVNGQPIPDDLGQRHLAAGQRGAIIAAEREVLSRAEASAVSRRDEALRQGADHGIRALRALLAQVLDTARQAAADLGGIDSADAAITAGRAHQWQQLADATRQYKAIRAEQRALYAAAGGHTTVNGHHVDHRSLFDMTGHIANVDDIWPDWLDFHRSADGTPPWPENDDRAYLTWLVTHPDAKPWVPSLAELGAAFSRQQQAAQTREFAAQEEAEHGRRLTPEERQRNADKAAARNNRQAQRAARIAAASNY